MSSHHSGSLTQQGGNHSSEYSFVAALVSAHHQTPEVTHNSISARVQKAFLPIA